MSRKRTTADRAGLPLSDRQPGSPNGIRDKNVDVAKRATGMAAIVKLAKLFAAALVVIAGVSAAPRPAAAGAAPADFIRTLGDQALAVMRSDASLVRKAAYFHRMLRQDFDLDDMSRFVLGPYWRIASAAQRQEFRSLLEDYIVRFDGVRLAQYGGKGFRVTGSRTDPAGVIVTSQVIRPQGPPIEIDWRLATSNGLYKISDLTIDGMSMTLARRSEFAAVIERDGGQVESLLALLRWRVGRPVFGARTVSLSLNSSGGIAGRGP